MSIIDSFDRLYISLDNRCSILNRLRIYSIARLLVRLVANIVLPVYFRLTGNNKQYRLNPSDKASGRYIVTLTSFPVRTGRLWLVIETLLRQTRKPDLIVLWLSQQQYRDWDVIPQSLRRLQKRGLTIRLVPEDYRSHKKYYYSLKEFPDDHLITIDDDVFYDTHLIERMLEVHDAHPSAVVANKTHQIRYDEKGEILPYMKWEHNSRQNNNLFAVGAGANLYPAHCMDNMADDISLAMKLTPMGDDIWLNAMVRLKHTEIIHASHYFNEQIPVINFNDVSLRTSNLTSTNDIQIHKLMDYLMEQHRENPFDKGHIY